MELILKREQHIFTIRVRKKRHEGQRQIFARADIPLRQSVPQNSVQHSHGRGVNKKIKYYVLPVVQPVYTIKYKVNEFGKKYRMHAVRGEKIAENVARIRKIRPLVVYGNIQRIQHAHREIVHNRRC